MHTDPRNLTTDAFIADYLTLDFNQAAFASPIYLHAAIMAFRLHTSEGRYSDAIYDKGCDLRSENMLHAEDASVSNACPTCGVLDREAAFMQVNPLYHPEAFLERI